jgi:hypothetical protein
VSSDNKNIVSNNKFKQDLLNKANNLKNIKNNLNNKYNNKNKITISTKKDNRKKSIPVLKFEKIKKDLQKNSYKNNEMPSLRNKKQKNKMKNSENETISSIDNISDNELQTNENEDNANKYKAKKKKQRNISLNKYYKNKKNDDEIEEQSISNQSTRIHVHKFNRNNSNIKIQIKSPLSPTIKFHQIDIKANNNGYRVFQNNFRKNKNYIEAKNKDDIDNNKDNNLLKSIKVKTGLKPLKMNALHNSNEGKNIAINNYLQNSKSSESKLNLLIQNNENSNYNREHHHHAEGYERHYGKEEKCPLCKNMKKKSEYMEEKIFGPEHKKFISKPITKKEDLKITGEYKELFMKKFLENPNKEEEKNINNNYNTINKDVNPYNTLQCRSKQNFYKDNQTKFISKRNQSMKNFNKKNESNKSLISVKDSNLGNIFDIQFPAINSYFHS